MDLRFDETRNLVRIRLLGRLDRDTILGALEACVADPRYASGMGRLWDFTEADLSQLDSDTVREMAQYTLKFPPGIGDVKVALVTARNLDYGLSRMFEMSSRAATPIRVFRAMDEAVAWLAE
jgi:hypothetical protein